MTIDIATEYPGKVDTSDPTNYPNGKARNVSAPGDGTGTPWRAPVLNDLIQINYALLAAAGITPSGTPDSVTTNQVFEAMQKLNGRQVFTADGTFTTPSWVKRIKVTAVGGGGAGGATDNDSIATGGGGGGGMAVAIIDDPAASYAVEIGLGGVGPAAGVDADGPDGGSTIFGGSPLLRAGGGEGGGGGARVAGGLGGQGGEFSGTAASILSEYGGNGRYGDASTLSGGDGGASRFGRAGRGLVGGKDAVGYGAGGGGAPSSAFTGGNGAPGLVIVEWGIGV